MSNTAAFSITVPKHRYLYWGLFLNTQLLAVLGYVLFSDGQVQSLQFTAFGLIWINVGVWVLTSVRIPPSDSRTRNRAAGIAAGYFGLLAIAGGLVSTGVGEAATGFRLAILPPGWGPAPLYSGYYVNVTLLPAYVVGYVALAYLVYAAVIDTAGSAKAAVLGLFTCVSCSWPILAVVVSTVFGGGSILAASALELSYELSTVIFLLTVGLLYWRPTITSKFDRR
ncbi:MAG: DUF7546 family protein [Halobacteriota archaeon]